MEPMDPEKYWKSALILMIILLFFQSADIITWLISIAIIVGFGLKKKIAFWANLIFTGLNLVASVIIFPYILASISDTSGMVLPMLVFVFIIRVVILGALMAGIWKSKPVFYKEAKVTLPHVEASKAGGKK